MKIRHTSLRTPVNVVIVLTILIASLLAWFIAAKLVAAADPEVTGGLPVSGVTDEFITVQGIQIEGDIVGSTVLTASTTSGTLRFANTTGLTFNGPTNGRNVSVNGTKEALNNALASLQYRANYEGEATISVTLGRDDVVYYPGNGHLYEVVSVPSGISWNDAKTAAEGREMLGASGYLATISDEDENDYITARLVGDGWFGASDQAVEGEWRWVAGPETGILFWLGNGSGQLQEDQFANWASSEPNNSSGGEHCAQFYGNGSGWNDLPCTMTLSSYVVEYGDEGDLPAIPPSSTTVHVTATTTTREPETVTLSTCEQFFDEYVNSTEHRYDTIILGQDLDCGGAEVTPLFSDYEYDEETGDTYYIGFQGSFDGNGKTISNLSIHPVNDHWGNPLPAGLFGRVDDGATIEDLTLEGATIYGDSCVGGIVGRANGITLRNTHFDGTIDSSSDEYSYVQYAGGLVGCLYNEADEVSTIEQSSGLVTIAAEEADAAGGLIGHASVSEEGGVANIENNTAQIISIDDSYGVGGAIGQMYIIDEGAATISAITVNGEVRGGELVGGLVGELDVLGGHLLIENIHLDIPIYAQYSYAGGLIGDSYVSSGDQERLLIQNVSSTGNVFAREYVGGLIGYAGGYNSDGERIQLIQRSFATGDVTATDGGVAGGLIGYGEAATVSESFATGDVTADGSEVGGLIGHIYATTLSDTYARGDVTNDDDSTGGLVGAIDRRSLIENSYSTGKILPAEDEQGGIGGLIGLDHHSDLEVTSSYWDVQTSGYSTSAYGEGKTTAQMKNRATYLDWDFDTWGITKNSNNGYPCLLWYEGCATDDDNDGISDAEEAAAPNDGDANNDNTPDSQQSNVASFVSQVTNNYISLEVDPRCTIVSVSSITEGQNTELDADYHYQTGLLDFLLDCDGEIGFTAYVKQYYYGVDSINNLVVRKYNPNTKEYWTITGNGLSLDLQNIGGQSVAVLGYNVTDGGDLDVDGLENGYIADPVGLALGGTPAPSGPSLPLPNTGLAPSSYGYLAIILGATGLVMLSMAVRIAFKARSRD